MILETPSQRRDLLDRARKIAMVGASDSPQRPSYFVFRYLLTHGFDVKPINPNHQSIDGIRCYATLQDYARENGPPDVVDVFRKPGAAPQVALDAVAVKAKAIWFQYGVLNQEAIRIADEAGLQVVVDRCMKVEHGRFSGGLSITGMDSGVLTAKRRKNVAFDRRPRRRAYAPPTNRCSTPSEARRTGSVPERSSVPKRKRT